MHNEDQFLYTHRRDPAPGYARRLRETLRDIEEPAHRPVWRPLVAVAAGLAVVVSLFAFPAVRAGAQAMLDMFRVRNFVPVTYNPERFDKLRALKDDRAMLVFDKQEVLQDPGEPVVQPSPGMAAAVAGYPVETPSFLPKGLALDTVAVTGEGRVKLGASTAKLRDVLDALDLRDVQVPAGLDGQELTVHMYPVVSQRFSSSGKHRLALVQSRSPEVTMPSGVDIARLGEIGLRILGVEAGEARRMASSIDWRSTLLVPVPTTASNLRQVTVQGNPGLLVTTEQPKSDGGRRREGSVLVWTEGDRVFALMGTLSHNDLMQVAESIR